MIFVVKLRFHEERRSPVIIWLWFSSVCFGKFPKIFKICENCPTDHFKAEKIGVKEAISSLFAILCFLPLSQIWSYEFLLSTGTGEGTNMFNGPTNLKRFHLKKRDQSSSKDPHFLHRNYNALKYNFANVYIRACENFRICCFICFLLAVSSMVFSFRLTSFSGAPKYHVVKKSSGASLNIN